MLVINIRKFMPRVGGRKLYFILKKDLIKHNINIGRDKFFKMLKQQCLLVPKLKSFNRTTDSNHLFNKHSNLVKGMNISKPEQLWVSDITYIKTKNGNLYLSLVTDAYSKKIMGFNIADNLKAESAKKALCMAIKNRRYPIRKLIHHSDRGIQYCCPLYTNHLIKHNIQISMTKQYDPYENSIAERVNGILKNEFNISCHRQKSEDALKSIMSAINIYNNHRPHFSCKLMTPNTAHIKGRFIYKKWGNFSFNEIWN